MKIETQPREDQQVQIIAEFEASVMDDFKRRAARKISREAKISGFRPGKAPYDVIKRLYGDELLEKEAIELMMDHFYPEVLKEADIKPSGPGTLDNILSVNPPKFSFIVPLIPEVVLPDYRKIRKEYAPVTVSEDDVNKTIDNLRLSFATAEPVERPAKDGDMVYLKIGGTLVKPEEGEDAEFIKETPMQVVIGREEENGNWPYPGFTQEIVGLSANQEKKIKYTYPKDSEYEKLRGKKVEFNVQVQSIKEMTLPELNNEFVQTLGQFESVEKLRETVQTDLENRTREEYDQKFFNEMVEEIQSNSTIKYPPNLLNDEINHILEHFKEDLAERKMDLETYLKVRQMTYEKFIEEEVKSSATKRLERSLVVDEITRNEKLQLDKKELEKAMMEALQNLQYQGAIDERHFKTNAARQNLSNAIAYDTANRLMSQQLVERMKLIASGEAPELTVNDEEGDEKTSSKTKKTTTKGKKAAAETAEEKPAKKAKAAKSSAD